MNLFKINNRHMQLNSNSLLHYQANDHSFMYSNGNKKRSITLGNIDNHQSIMKRIYCGYNALSSSSIDKDNDQTMPLVAITDTTNKRITQKDNGRSIIKNTNYIIDKNNNDYNKTTKSNFDNGLARKTIKLKSHKHNAMNSPINAIGLLNDNILSKNSINCKKLKHKPIMPSVNPNDNKDINQIPLIKEEKKVYRLREINGFRLIEILGKGGYSIVWLAKDKLNTEYAIKQITKNNKEAIRTAKKEIKMLQYISSLPNKTYNLITYKSSYESVTDYWIIFENGGISLSHLSFKIQKPEVINQEKVYPIKQTLFHKKMLSDDLKQFKFLIKSLLSFIHFISSYGIVHSDIKPDNILISYDKKSYDIINTKVIDFGSAFFIDNPIGFASNTPEYMSPEIIHLIDNSLVSSSALSIQIKSFLKTFKEYPYCIDIWSLGVTLLDLVLACPVWLSHKAKIVINDKTIYTSGLIGFKERKLNNIYQKQIEISKNIHGILEDCVIGNIHLRNSFEDLIKKMLTSDYHNRIPPSEALRHPFLR